MILYNLYGLFCLIYDKVVLTFLNVKDVNNEHLPFTVKFAADIISSESSKYCEEVHKGFMNLFMNDFICDFFKMLFSRKLFTRKPVSTIPKHFSVYKAYKAYYLSFL